MKNLRLFISLVIIFSAIIFYADLFFSQKNETEDFNKIVEPIKKISPQTKKRLEEIRQKIQNNNKKNEEKIPELTSATPKDTKKVEKNTTKSNINHNKNYIINFILDKYEQELEQTKINSIKKILESDLFSLKLYNIITDLMQVKEEVRGKMKHGTVYMFAPHLLSNSEMISVFVHELGHFVDLYYFKKSYFGDASNNFYDISWHSTKVLKKANNKKDFVSGYAMTNKYEDFAESFEFFILHNKEFLKKAQDSDKLMKKFMFFEEFLFTKGEFKNSNFGENKVDKSIWDTTKLKISEKKFLNYIKND